MFNQISLSNWVRGDLTNTTGRSVTCDSDVTVFAPFDTSLFFSEPVIGCHSYKSKCVIKHGFGRAIVEDSAFVTVKLGRINSYDNRNIHQSISDRVTVLQVNKSFNLVLSIISKTLLESANIRILILSGYS